MADCLSTEMYKPATNEEIVRLVRRRRGGRGGAAPISTGRPFKMTAPVDWTKICTANPGRPIKTIPFTRLNKFFGVNMSDVEIEMMKDRNGDI
jgi:hypothetical protein